MIISEISNFKKDQLRYELRNEPPNNFAIYIDGKKWKVFKGEGFNADDAREQKQFTRLQNLCKRKSFETGKDWQVGKTGEQPTQEGMFDKIKKAVDDVKNFHKTDAAKQIRKDHAKRVQKGKEIIDAPNLRKRIQGLQQNEAEQAKASDPKPKLIKPSKGGESPHPMRGKLVGEAVPYSKSVQKDLDDRIWNAKPPVKKDKNKASDDVERERRWKNTVKTKAEEDVTRGNFGGVIYPRLPHEEVLDAISSWEYGDTPIQLSNGYVINAREEGYNDDDNAWVLLDPQGKIVDAGEGSIEDVMQDFTPIAIEEGKSPHKKGSAKYKKHMAAMHAGINEGPLVLNRESDLRGMLNTLLKSWLSKGDKSDDEYAELLKALGYRMVKDGQRTTLVKETEEPKADTSARAKLDHSLRAQGHKVEKDKKKELKKGAVKHKSNLYDNLISLEK